MLLAIETAGDTCGVALARGGEVVEREVLHGPRLHASSLAPMIQRAMHAAGFRERELVHISFAYHFTPGAWMMDSGARALRCPVFPAGTGNTELQARTIAELKPAAYAGTPSFLKIILDDSVRLGLDLSSLKHALVSGEAFPPSLRQAVRARGIDAYQCYATADLGLIAGQKPVITKARKSIATFKLREGMPIGAKVTLRKNRMYEFVDRLVNIALPRVRDFRGLNPKSFDGRGNYAIGLKEHIIFPEINFDKVEEIWGMDIIVCTTARTDEEARALLKHLNFPFRS